MMHVDKLETYVLFLKTIVFKWDLWRETGVSVVALSLGVVFNAILPASASAPRLEL